jgi:hypothetical protein
MRRFDSDPRLQSFNHLQARLKKLAAVWLPNGLEPAFSSSAERAERLHARTLICFNRNRKVTSETQWRPFVRGSPNAPGSEGGNIMLDEEHKNGARITLECKTHVAPFAITCGIYGAFFHTCYFADEIEALHAFTEMKAGLSRILDLLGMGNTSDSLVTINRAISRFVERFPT